MLREILDDAREDATRLRKTGNVGQAEYVDRLVLKLERAVEDYVTWLSESDAVIKSGLAERTLRSRFRWLRSCGLARYGVKGRREYLACGIPQRVLLDSREGGHLG
jgi:hypothetical protein